MKRLVFGRDGEYDVQRLLDLSDDAVERELGALMQERRLAEIGAWLRSQRPRETRDMANRRRHAAKGG